LTSETFSTSHDIPLGLGPRAARIESLFAIGAYVILFTLISVRQTPWRSLLIVAQHNVDVLRTGRYFDLAFRRQLDSNDGSARFAPDRDHHRVASVVPQLDSVACGYLARE
jgi:hypothetical protein